MEMPGRSAIKWSGIETGATETTQLSLFTKSQYDNVANRGYDQWLFLTKKKHIHQSRLMH